MVDNPAIIKITAYPVVRQSTSRAIVTFAPAAVVNQPIAGNPMADSPWFTAPKSLSNRMIHTCAIATSGVTNGAISAALNIPRNLALRNATAIVSASSTCAGTTSSQSTPDVAIDCQKSGLVNRYR